MPIPRRTFFPLCGVPAFPNLPAFAAPPITAAQIANDTSRPQFHLVGQANRINDPNGPIFFNGHNHIFYQKASPGGKHWGHATSPDMIHWKHVPDAIAPTPGSYDGVNCASGCCVIDNGTPTILYTGFRPEVQCLATSDKEMIVWHKYAGNPVIPAPPKGHYVMPKSSSAAPDKPSSNPNDIALTGFRDPHVWNENGQWLMIVGSGFHRRGGAPLLYRSRDLRKWEYLHPLCVGFRDMMAWGGRPHDTGEVWECPDFFPLGGKHVLIVSTMLRTQYFVGRYENLRFHPEVGGCCDFGHYYAGTSQADARGERILWGWVREMQDRAGWGAAISLPRVLTLAPDGTLRYAFARELDSLRGNRVSVPPGLINPETPQVLSEAHGDSLDITVEMDPAQASHCGLAVLRSPDGAEETRILYRAADRVLQVDLSRSSLKPGKSAVSRPLDTNGLLHAPLELPTGEPLRLRVVVDASVIEIIANGRACLTARSYPSRADATGVALLAVGGTARLNRLDAFPMSPISKDRLTT